MGAPKDCSATALPNECNTAVCDPTQNGDCVVVPTLDGLPCVIGDPCESDKACLAGTCIGDPISGCSLCGETEPNNDIPTANVDATCTGWQGQIGVAGDWDTYAVEVTIPGSRIRAQTSDVNGVGCPGFDSIIRLYNASGIEIAANDSSPVNSPCSLLDTNTPGATNLAVGTYYVRVQQSFSGTSSPYLLLLNTYAPGCGDGILQTGEQCDDNNTTDGDGCSSTCALFTCAAGETLVDLSATDLPVSISDNTTSTSTMTVAQTGTLTKVAIVVNITHTYDGDLVLTIDPPAANPVVLSSNIGGSGENYTSTVFSSDATIPVSTSQPPYTGVFAPTPGSFASTLGTAVGSTWTFTVQDTAGGDFGAINAWKLVGCVQP